MFYFCFQLRPLVSPVHKQNNEFNKNKIDQWDAFFCDLKVDPLGYENVDEFPLPNGRGSDSVLYSIHLNAIAVKILNKLDSRILKE